MSTLSTRQARVRRHRRVRGKIAGTADRPRLAVFRSNRGIFARLIDDDAGRTLASASWLALKGHKGSKTDQASAVGKEIGAAAAKGGGSTWGFARGRRLCPRRADA